MIDTRVDEALRAATIFRRLSGEDRQRLAAVAALRTYGKGEYLFHEGEAPDWLFTVASGRVKVTKSTPHGTDVILEIFGAGDPVGAVAVYEMRPYPASAVALEPTTCLALPQSALFSLIDSHPSIVRGLLTGLTHRLVELTHRLAELSTGRIDARLARFLLRLADNIGQPAPDGTDIPFALSRQELADMTGTTLETAIRIMSRWGKEGVVRTERTGFVITDRTALETIALS